jgi:hypothetical protein
VAFHESTLHLYRLPLPEPHLPSFDLTSPLTTKIAAVPYAFGALQGYGRQRATLLLEGLQEVTPSLASIPQDRCFHPPSVSVLKGYQFRRISVKGQGKSPPADDLKHNQ